MDKIINLVEQEIAAAFDKAGYDRALAKVTLSNRPDLCEYQCNGAMAGAKKYKKAPFMIAEDVLANLTDKTYIGEIEVVKPGFINIKLNEDAVAAYLNDMKKMRILAGTGKGTKDDRNRLRRTERSKTVTCRTSSFCSYRRECEAYRKKSRT